MAGLCRAVWRRTGSSARLAAQLSCSTVSSRQSSSSPSEHLLLSTENGVAQLKMNKKPVNSLSLEFLTDLHITLDKLESDRDVNALVLTSAVPGIFSAGLDITEMYQPDKDRLAVFWRAFQDIFLRLYGSNLITIAAINGHSPAGGCLLAMCCDYRIMLEGKFTIGLNETLVGIVAPFWFQDLFVRTVGHRAAEKGLQLGAMYPTAEALKLGMVDEVVAADQMQQAVLDQLNMWSRIPAHARQITKQELRRPALQKLQARQDEDVENFVNFITKDPIQRAMGAYLESLKAKQKK